MNTIRENKTYEVIINKSRFITVLVKVKNIEEVKSNLENIRNVYKDATHYCYAYIIDDMRKSSDDGEPGGTAGVPMMEILLKNELNYVLCIVVRYFGGIKLGAGGLVRAYASSCKDALEGEIIPLIYGKKIKFITTYDNQKAIDYYLKDFKVLKTYHENVIYEVDIPNDYVEKLLTYKLDVILVNDILIEKK